MFWRRRKYRDEELDREIRSHLDLEAEEQQQNGLTPEEARFAAKRALGNETLTKESVRATWRWAGCEPIAQDLRNAVRLLHKSPVITCVAVLSLALGIGANTAIFGVINALMLRTLPVRDPQQLVSIGALDRQHPQYPKGLSVAMFQDIQEHASGFADVFLWTGGAMDNIEANGVRYAGTVDAVSGDYFADLGIRQVLGRLLTHKDAPLNGRPSSKVAVISYGCWQNRFGADPHVLGKTIRIGTTELVIVGVSPPGFTGFGIDNEPEATIPIGATNKLNYRESMGYYAYARLKPGVSISQARAEIRVLWPGMLKSTVPDSFHGKRRSSFLSQRPSIQPAARGYSYMRGKLGEPLELLMALVGAVLLIACVNLANLLLARASSRRHEFAVRAAMGAGRWPLMRMLLIEALLLSCTGAAFGILIAQWAARYLLQSFWIGYVPLSINPSPDARVLMFTAGLAIFTGVLFGIVPAWQMSRSDPAASLSQSARTTGGRTGRFSRALVASQVSLSLVLLIGATLFVYSLENLQHVNLGYSSDHLLIMQLFPEPGREKIPHRTAYFHELTDRLLQLPSVESASYVDVGILNGYEIKASASTGVSGNATSAVKDAVGPGFFRMIGMRLLAGRGFTWHDDEHAPRIAVISKSLARLLFPNRSPIGRTIQVGSEQKDEALRVVGVVNSASLWRFRDRNPPAVYQPLLQEPLANWPRCVIRTRGNPLAIAHAAEQTLVALGNSSSLRTETLKQRTDETLINQRMIALLASGFSLLALLLAAIGLYGVMSYAVTRRTAEIGIRVALGAMRADVLRMILGEVLLLIVVGIAIALPIAFACNKFISGMLFGVSAADPVVVIVACSILIAVALFAGFLPARRASRVDPVIALRYE